MDDFDKELKMGFLEEASHLLTEAEQCFLILESNPNDKPTLEKIFRIAHNIKGSSKAVGFNDLGAFTHEFESFLIKCKSGEISLNGPTISLLLECNDHLKRSIDILKGNPEAKLDSEALTLKIYTFRPDQSKQGPTQTAQAVVISEVKVEPPVLPAAAPQPQSPSPSVPPPASTAAPVPSRSAAPVIELKPSQKAVHGVSSAPEPGSTSTSGTSASDETIRVSLSRLERLLNFVGELVIMQTVLKEQAYQGNTVILRKTIHQMGKVTKEVQDLSMSLRMVPLKQTFQKMQRIVRDTSSVLKKKVNLVLQGEETEVDKTVLEALSDPLVHMIRNAVDHGIETPAERIAKGKPEFGQINLRAYHEGGKLVIEVKDNGGGISAERLRQKGLEKGITKPGQNLSDKDAINLIFHPGFSTKSEITEVSGRGVGMDVVKTNIEQMQGEVLVETVFGSGSTFKIVLPLTLAIIEGMVVKSGDDRYVIPLAHVHESVKPEPGDIKFATGTGEVLLLRGENLPVVRLSNALGGNKSSKAVTEQIAIIIRTLDKPFATLVDDVVGQHQVVIKKLGAEIQNLRGYSGSAILGDGRPALILELGDLIKKNYSNSSPSQKRIQA